MRRFGGNEKGNMFLVVPIVLVIAFMGINFLLYDVHPDSDFDGDDAVDLFKDETGWDFWFFDDIIDLYGRVLNVVTGFLEIVYKFVVIDIHLINQLQGFAWFVKTPIWMSEIIGIIKILPFT